MKKIKRCSIIMILVGSLFSAQQVFAHGVLYETKVLPQNKLNISLKWSDPEDERGLKITYFYLTNGKVLNLGYEATQEGGGSQPLDFDLSGALTPIRIVLRNPEISDKNFLDIGGSEAEEYIRHLHDCGIVNGRSMQAYNPFDKVTRAEFLVLLLKALKITPLEEMDQNFTDIHDHWAKGYIMAAFKKGMINGYGDGSFKPNGNITVAEACKMITQSFSFKTHQNLIFSKLRPGKWYSEVVKKVFEASILSPSDTLYKSFDEEASINRANTAIMISRALSTY